jgi:hypothetical protein
MSDDLPNFDVADQLHDDLLVKWLTDSNNTGFANNLETGTSVDEVPKTTSKESFSTGSLGAGFTHPRAGKEFRLKRSERKGESDARWLRRHR